MTSDGHLNYEPYVLLTSTSRASCSIIYIYIYISLNLSSQPLMSAQKQKKSARWIRSLTCAKYDSIMTSREINLKMYSLVF